MRRRLRPKRLAAIGVLALATGGVLGISTLSDAEPDERAPIRIRAECDAHEARTQARCDDDGDHVPCDEMEHMTEWQCRGPVELATPPPTPSPVG